MKTKLIEEHTTQTVERFNTHQGIYPNGEENNYPEVIENLISVSPTAGQCAWLYESFLGGAGFEIDFNNVNLSDGFMAYTPNDLLIDVAESLAKHQGVFIHVNYNALYEKDSFSVIPFTQCRLGKKDDHKYNGKILVSEEGWGKYYKKKDVKTFDVFNPRPEVIQAQVDAAEGWPQYKGQILYFTFQPKRMYPKSLLESAYLFADTEYRMGLFYNSTAKRGFNDNSIVRHAKFESKQDENDFDNNLKNLMGTDNGSNILRVEDDFSESEQGNVRIDKISSDVKADRYAHFETAAANYIRKAFKNIPPQLVDYVQGKLGNTTGEDLIKAQSVYNQLTARDRAKVSRLFSILFDGYKMDINPGRNWEIKQYKLLDDGTVN